MARPLKYPFPKTIGEVSSFTVPQDSIADVLRKLIGYMKRSGHDFDVVSDTNEAGEQSFTMTRTQ